MENGINKSLTFWMFGISIILFSTSLCLNISSTVITNESIVLTFVGILATFIVVGNFAQVTEIRNNTNTLIRDLETNMQSKIDELKTLHKKVEDATDKLSDIENRTNFNTAEAYRLYGSITYEKGDYKLSTSHYIEAIYYYNICKENKEVLINNLFNITLNNLKPENWHKPNQNHDFKFNKKIELIKNVSDNYNQKQKIIKLLEKYKINDTQ
jgi:hypothetical protein